MPSEHRLPRPRLSLWSHRDFAHLWMAHGVANLGARITREALPLTAIMLLGASPAQIAWMAALILGPGLFAGLFAGHWIDRLRKRGLMIVLVFARALILLTIPAAALLDALHMMHLYAVALGMGTLSAFFEIADQSYLPTLVSRRRITEANSKLATTTALAETGGPALTGALVQGLSAPIAIAFDALAFLVSGCALLRIRRREKLPAAALAAKRPLWRGVQEGWAASFAEPEVRAVFVANVMIAFFAPMFVPVYAYYAIHDLGMTPLLLGFAISCGGAGALAGAALTPVLARRFGTAPMLITGLSMLGVAQLLVPLAHGRPEAATGWLAIAQFIGDGFFVFYLVNELSVRQQTLAPAVLGRANASLRMATGALAPAGILLAGLLADAVGPRPVLWISVGGILGTALLLAVLLPSRITSPRAAVT